MIFYPMAISNEVSELDETPKGLSEGVLWAFEEIMPIILIPKITVQTKKGRQKKFLPKICNQSK